jgi:hypothetical protein
MIHVMLNPPKKKVGGKKKGGSSKRRKHGPRVCMPKSELRHAKSLKRLKRKILRKLPRKKILCFPKASIRAATSLKKFKHKYAGVKYGFARKPFLRLVSGGSAVPSPTISTKAPRPIPAAKKPRLKVVKPAGAKGRKYTYMEMFGLTPWERSQRGIRPSHMRKAEKKGHVYVTPPAPPKPPKSVWPKGEIAANPMRARNYPLPVYSFNDAAQLDGLRNGLTAGYRPSAMKAALPLVGGLVANSLLSALANKLTSKQWTIPDRWKNPIGLAVGLGTAGVLSAITRLIAPKYAKPVFWGALAQVGWDGYQNYVAPSLKKTLGLDGLKNFEAGSDTFGLWCDECDRQPDITDHYPQPVVSAIPANIDAIVGSIMPPSAITVQSPPNVSAPTSEAAALTAMVNGHVVPVERIPSQAPGMSDFLTPNQVASATSLGDTGDMSSYL